MKKGLIVLLSSTIGFATCSLLARPEGGSNVPTRIARQKNPLPPNEHNLAIGKSLYKANCAECHGPCGKGDGSRAADLDPRPSDLTDDDVARQSDGTLFWKITRGRKPMPGFERSLDENERWLVVLYLRTLGHHGDQK